MIKPNRVRRRLVIFRMDVKEYQEMVKAYEASEDRSVSEYVRVAVMERVGRDMANPEHADPLVQSHP